VIPSAHRRVLKDNNLVWRTQKQGSQSHTKDCSGTMTKGKKDVRFSSHPNGRRPSRPASDAMDGTSDEKSSLSPTKGGQTEKSGRPVLHRNQSTDAGWTDDEKVSNRFKGRGNSITDSQIPAEAASSTKRLRKEEGDFHHADDMDSDHDIGVFHRHVRRPHLHDYNCHCSPDHILPGGYCYSQRAQQSAAVTVH